MADTRRAITILGVILVLVVVAAGAVLWLLPSAEEEPLFVSPTASPAADTPLFQDAPSPVAPVSDTQLFNLDVLRGTLYQSLNHQVINDGSLPVQPPAATGKANPFL